MLQRKNSVAAASKAAMAVGAWVAAAAASAALLGGCGQKGPLVLPSTVAASAPSTTATPPARPGSAVR
jgi:predicted small lipoprotein YifL